MLLKSRWTSVCLFLSMTSSIYAQDHSRKINKLERLIDKYDLEPLAESEYWKEHPNVLPYEECRLMKADGSRLEGLRMNLGFGQIHYKDGLSIFCFSKTLKLGFQIPVHIHKDSVFGFGVNFNIDVLTSGHVRDLNQKSLVELYGHYTGFGGGIGVGTSASGAILRNNGILLTLNQSRGKTLLELSAGVRKVHLGSRSLRHDEIYSIDFLEKMSHLKTLIDEHIIPTDEDSTDFIKFWDGERQALLDEPEEQKFAPTWKFWIHHLQADLDAPDACGRQDQSCRRSCPSPVRFAKLLGHLDPDFLSTLHFEEIQSPKRLKRLLTAVKEEL